MQMASWDVQEISLKGLSDPAIVQYLSRFDGKVILEEEDERRARGDYIKGVTATSIMEKASV